jgi:DNA-binding response OmpR family regulator
MKILIIEDESSLAEPLKEILKRNQFLVDWVDNGEDGLAEAEINEYDCILLDLNLPGIDGIELARKLRAMKNTVPIIMVTARSQIYDKLEGFDSGADDYVTKPFSADELIARINAVIKRNSENKAEELMFGNWILKADQNKVVDVNNEDRSVELTNKESSLLEYLLRNKGKIISTEEILEHVWDSEVNIFTDTVKTHIKTLRQKLDPDKKVLRTVRGKGYTVKED